MSRIAVLAAVPWDGPRLSDQRLAAALASGHEVVYVDPPASIIDRAVRARIGRVERPMPGIVRRSVAGPPGWSRRGIWPLTRTGERWQLRRIASDHGPVDAVVTTSPLRGADRSLGPAPVAYLAKDDPASMGPLIGVPTDRLVAGHQRLLATVEVVSAPSPALLDQIREVRPDAQLLPHGVDQEMLRAVESAAPDRRGLDPPVVGFVGGLTSRVSWSHLEAVAERGRSLLLVGGVGKRGDPGPVQRLARRPNVVWTGQLPYWRLPALFAAIDVGVVPYVDDDFNQASFPLKIFEYLAAGAPVVSTPLQVADWFDTPLVRTAGSPAEFAAAVEEQLATAKSSARDARNLAVRNTWEQRAGELLDRLLGDASRSS